MGSISKTILRWDGVISRARLHIGSKYLLRVYIRSGCRVGGKSIPAACMYVSSLLVRKHQMLPYLALALVNIYQSWTNQSSQERGLYADIFCSTCRLVIRESNCHGNYKCPQKTSSSASEEGQYHIQMRVFFHFVSYRNINSKINLKVYSFSCCGNAWSRWD